MLTLNAHAKLNLCLDIKGKRADNYHEIEFINTELALHDTITIEKSSKIEILTNNPNIPTDHTNLCYKAAELLKKKVKITIDKQIPNGGLGSGSTDCAAVLNGINELYELQLSQDELIELASTVSTDACFSVIGGTALVKGKGEIVEPLQPIPKLSIIIINPGIQLDNKTRTLYSNINFAEVIHPNIESMKTAISQKDSARIISSTGNAFHSVRLPEYKESFDIIRQISSQGYKAMLAGSGPLVVAFPKSQKEAEDIAKQFKNTIITETK